MRFFTEFLLVALATLSLAAASDDGAEDGDVFDFEDNPEDVDDYNDVWTFDAADGDQLDKRTASGHGHSGHQAKNHVKDNSGIVVAGEAEAPHSQHGVPAAALQDNSKHRDNNFLDNSDDKEGGNHSGKLPKYMP